MVKHVSALKSYELNFFKFTTLATLNFLKLNLNKMFSINKNLKSKEATEKEEKAPSIKSNVAEPRRVNSALQVKPDSSNSESREEDEKIELLDQLILENKEDTEGEDNIKNLHNLLKRRETAEKELSDLSKTLKKYEHKENISSTDVDSVFNNLKPIFENQF